MIKIYSCESNYATDINRIYAFVGTTFNLLLMLSLFNRLAVIIL